MPHPADLYATLTATAGTDWPHRLNRAVHDHLTACTAAYEDGQGDTPATEPFDGCDDCITREVTHATLVAVNDLLTGAGAAPWG